MSGTSTWNSSVGTGSFFPGATSATPAALFGQYNGAASADQHNERAVSMALWLRQRQDAPVSAIAAALGALQEVQEQAAVGAEGPTEAAWLQAAVTADQALEGLVATYLNASADDRAIVAIRDHGGLSQTAPSSSGTVASWVARMTASGITPTLTNGSVSYAGGTPGPADVEFLNSHRREITMYLIEA